MYQIRKKAIVRRMKGVDKKTVFFFCILAFLKKPKCRIFKPLLVIFHQIRQKFFSKQEIE